MSADKPQQSATRPGPESVEDIALARFIALRSGEADEADHAAHQLWLAQDPRHAGADAKLAQLWSELGEISDPRRQARPEAAPRLSRRFALTGGLAAAAGLAAWSFTPLSDFLLNDAYTATGETKDLALADGSRVRLDADSALDADFSGAERQLHLKRGRALFDLVDEGRPFTLQAGDGQLKSQAGRFSVHLWRENTTVAVESGSAMLTLSGHAPALLNMGERLTFNARGMGQTEACDPEIDTAWLRGKMIFDDRPLGQVLADLSRYRSGSIRTTSAALLEMRVSGVFDIQDTDAVLTAIAASLPVRVTRVTPYLVVVSAA